MFKERVLWASLIGGFFFLCYGSASQISALTAPHASFYWQWERSIPFIPEFVLPYMSSDIVFVIAFLMVPSRSAIQRLGLRCGLAIVISSCLFLVLPLQFGFQLPEVTGWPSLLFDVLAFDQPYNQFPSLHISLGFLCWHAIDRQLRGVGRTLAAAWFMLIAASTVLVYQHHFIDTLGGVAVAYVVHRIVPNKGDCWFEPGFVTPRHLHMALRYLILSGLAAIASFNVSAPWLLFACISLCLIVVSISYGLGENGFLRKTRDRHGIVTWCIFWPYLIGSWINWRFWRSRIPLMAEVQPGVWLGARPGFEDWQRVRRAKVRSVIDLVPELSSSPPHVLDYSHHPLLDIVIPAPSALYAIARTIEEKRQQGNVYVHCALGMSRSVLAVCAWLMLQGKSKEEALAAVDAARPNRVRRPYISIALALFEQHLRAFCPAHMIPADES
jgi:hypothetical protein